MNHDAAVQAINQTFDSAFDESRFEGLVVKGLVPSRL